MRIPTTSWTKLQTAEPRDITAARVVSQRGITVPISTPSTDPREEEEFSRPTIIVIPKGIEDKTGKPYGLYLVVGLHFVGERDGASVHLWAVKCRCGRHRIKNSKALKQAKWFKSGCNHCSPHRPK